MHLSVLLGGRVLTEEEMWLNRASVSGTNSPAWKENTFFPLTAVLFVLHAIRSTSISRCRALP